jgi:uncharacterized Fe-S cluster-containing radical SAM superfamily protein
MSSAFYCNIYMNTITHKCVSTYLNHVAFCVRLQEIAKEGKADTVEESAPPPAGSSESLEEILFNPNVFTEFKLSGNPEVNI